MIDKLRDEIIESEKARTDLMKWKLILVAAIGAAGLGLGSNASPNGNPVVLLALIPFVCLYVDAICSHNEIRIMTIAQFLRTRDENSVERKYEEYCTGHRWQFSLEGFALVVTTVGLSVLVLFIGWNTDLQGLIPSAPKAGDVAWKVLVWAGCAGAVASLVFYCFYRYKIYTLDRPV